jgi:hypothetical protein
VTSGILCYADLPEIHVLNLQELETSEDRTRVSEHFMKPEVSFSCTQEPTTGPYPRLVNRADTIPSYFYKVKVKVKFSLCLSN